MTVGLGDAVGRTLENRGTQCVLLGETGVACAVGEVHGRVTVGIDDAVFWAVIARFSSRTGQE